MSNEEICALLLGNSTSGNNSEPEIPQDSDWDYETYQIYSLWLNGIIMTVVIVVGLFGNITTCYILSLKPMRAKINPYIITLACWDSIVLATCWFLFSWGAIQHGELPSFGTQVYCYMTFYPVSNIAKTASIWILLTTSLERYFAISQPLHRQRLNYQMRFRLIVILTGIGAVIFNTSKFFEITIIQCSLGDEIVPAIVTTPLRDDQTYYVVYHVALNLLLISCGPFCIQAVLTGLISYHLRLSLRYRRRYSSVNSHSPKKKRHSLETSMNLMFVVVCLKFLICLLLPTGVNIAEMILKITDEEQLLANGPFAFLVDVSNLLAVTNSALNFPIYIAFCDRFRKMFVLCLTCRHASTTPGTSEFSPLATDGSRFERALSLPAFTTMYLHSSNNNKKSRSPQRFRTYSDDAFLEEAEDTTTTEVLSASKRVKRTKSQV